MTDKEHQFWSTEQPNHGNRHLRSVDKLSEGMSITVHQRIGPADHQNTVHIQTIDRKDGQIRICETNQWLKLSDFGILPTIMAKTKVWSRHNWLERA